MRIKVKPQVREVKGVAPLLFNVVMLLVLTVFGDNILLWIILLLSSSLFFYKIILAFRKSKLAIMQLDFMDEIVTFRFQAFSKNLQRIKQKDIKIAIQDESTLMFYNSSYQQIGYIERKFLEEPEDWEKIVSLFAPTDPA